MVKRWILPLVAASAIIASPAYALSMRLTDSNMNTSGILTDAGTGFINFNQALGSWNVNVTTGLGPPTLDPYNFDLNSVNVSNFGGSAGYLDIELSQDNLNANDLGAVIKFLGEIGGTTAGMVTWTLFLDDSNVLFGQGAAYGTDSSGAGAFSDTFVASQALTDEFSITLFVRINHGNGTRVSSFDYSVKLIPEPGTLALLGAALLGLVWFRRRTQPR